MSNNLKILGKYLDQPALIKKLNSSMPVVLSLSAIAYGVHDTYKATDKDKKNKFIQNFTTLSFTVASALIATRGLKIKGKEIFEGLIELPHLHKHDIDETLKKIDDKKIQNFIFNVKDGKVLKFLEIKELSEFLDTRFKGQNLLPKIIPDAHTHNGFEELKKLSLLGLIPVLGGIIGGIIGDKITTPDWKKKIPAKIKEGSYQYLNNIFLCNVGAGAAMILMNKLKVKSKAARFCAMMGGVIAVGLIAGNAIANFIGKNFINPVFDKKPQGHKNHGFKSMFKDLNSERHPEFVDFSLHIDDIASVGFLSGFKWIGPILPVLYSVSGYRSGIGYRNGEHG